MEADLALALKLADLADSISLPRFRSKELEIERKADRSFVTEVDRAVERALREWLSRVRPADAVVGEEYGVQGDGAVRWIVDPIDGTNNYLRGIPAWATLIALERDGEPVAGVASAPALGRRWWAARGRGAFADGSPIRVSTIDRLEEAQLCFSGLKSWRATGRLERLLELSSRCWRTRGFGDFWMHALVAEGSAEIAAEVVVNLWDLAAVKVIVEEAGGRFTDLSGAATPAGPTALSTNGLLHDRALSVLGG